MEAKSNSNSARLDFRLSKKQKAIFERAATIGGYRSLTDFFILTLLEKAKEIIEENEKVLATERDKEIFFNALMNPEKPNDALAAAKAYKDQL